MDIEKGDHINMQTVKTITGGDKTARGRLSKMMLLSVTKLPCYNNMATYTSNDRTRRLVVVPTLAHRKQTTRTSIPTDQESRSLLIACEANL
jgi:hypothetical protein